MKVSTENIEFACEELDHPERAAFGSDGNIYVGGEAGQIYQINPAIQYCNYYKT